MQPYLNETDLKQSIREVIKLAAAIENKKKNINLALVKFQNFGHFEHLFIYRTST